MKKDFSDVIASLIALILVAAFTFGLIFISIKAWRFFSPNEDLLNLFNPETATTTYPWTTILQYVSWMPTPLLGLFRIYITAIIGLMMGVAGIVIAAMALFVVLGAGGLCLPIPFYEDGEFIVFRK